MSQKRKQIRLLTLFTTLLIIFHVSNLFAMVPQSIHIKWDYDAYTAPVDAELSGYRLYKEGIQVCQLDTPYDFEGDCEFMSDNGLYSFNLTAVFDDGSESPRSATFPFLLGPKTTNAGPILAVLGLLLDI